MFLVFDFDVDWRTVRRRLAVMTPEGFGVHLQGARRLTQRPEPYAVHVDAPWCIGPRPTPPHRSEPSPLGPLVKSGEVAILYRPKYGRRRHPQSPCRRRLRTIHAIDLRDFHGHAVPRNPHLGALMLKITRPLRRTVMSAKSMRRILVVHDMENSIPLISTTSFALTSCTRAILFFPFDGQGARPRRAPSVVT